MTNPLPEHQPLKIPIQLRYSQKDDESNDSSDEQWITYHKLISANPCFDKIDSNKNESCITTVWEVSANDPARQRIAVYSGTLLIETKTRINGFLSNEGLHVSFMLPTSAQPPAISSTLPTTAICWTTFPDMHPTHTFLCCLVTSSSLCIWDVFPQSPKMQSSDGSDTSILPSEGWTITLPFDCRGIFSIPGAVGGLLLQRLEDSEDRVVTSVASIPEDDGFFLKGPPVKPNNNNPPTSSMVIEPQLHLPTAISNAVPSLFSLQHPLEDVLPVMESVSSTRPTSSNPRQQHTNALQGFTAVTDVFEQILWIGSAEWMERSSDKRDEGMMTSMHSGVIAVTYHTILGRHAVWKIDEAPAKPELPPLYTMIKSKYTTKISSGLLDAHNDLIIMDDQELLNDFMPMDNKQLRTSLLNDQLNVSPTRIPPRLSRAEALAEALGVRRTPRKSIEIANTRYKASEQQIHQHGNSFFSPSGVSPSNLSNRSIGDFLPTTGTSLTEGYRESTSNSVNGVYTAFSGQAIGARIAVTCLFRESNDSSSPADNVFIASNIESSSKLVLCLLCKRKSPATRNGNSSELKLLSLRPEKLILSKTDKTLSVYTFAVQLIKETFPCVSAQPVQASPVPSCFTIHRRDRKRNINHNLQSLATDILILDKRGSLVLYRSSIPICVCSLSDELKILDIANPVGDLLTFRCTSNDDIVFVRGKVSLISNEDDFVGSILSALDSGLCSVVPESDESNENSQLCSYRNILTMKIRADVMRLSQSPAPVQNKIGRPMSTLLAIIVSIAVHEVTGQSPLCSKKANELDETNSKVFHDLLRSDYHSSYSRGTNFFPGEIECDTSLDLLKYGDYEPEVIQLNGIRSLAVNHLKAFRPKIAADMDVFTRVFDALHFVYEESKLYVSLLISLREKLGKMLSFLCQLVVTIDPENAKLGELFITYYRKDIEDDSAYDSSVLRTIVKPIRKRVPLGSTFTSFARPPSIFQWLDGALCESHERVKSGWYNSEKLQLINTSCTRTRLLLKIFSVLLTRSPSFEQGLNRDAMIVVHLIEEGFTNVSELGNYFPPGVLVPILESLHRCRNNPLCTEKTNLSFSGWNLIGRSDMSNNLRSKEQGFYVDPSKHNNLESDNDGLVQIEKDSAMFFRNDNRVHEAARLLCSSRPIFLRVNRAVEVSDHDFERLKQERLLLLCYRSLALPIGRGMLTMDSLSPVPVEPLPQPDLCLKGRVPPTNATLNLDTSECPTDMRVWPEFHNGVASGLRLKVATSIKITRTWILYNRPPPSRSPSEDGAVSSQSQQHKTFSHGGLLLSLGLRGHLTALEMSDIYDYLTHGAVTTTVGVLLGLSANKRGSCDLSVSKMLCLHIPSLIPQHFSAIDVASSVQTAAVIGAGLLFQKSSHRMMTEFLINEIGKRPESDISTFDREAYTLACGLALGMVNLAVGEKGHRFDRAAGIADLRLEERLCRYITGGIDHEEIQRTREANDRFSLPSSQSNDNEKCSTIFEGDQINTDMTAPGAILALGLMHMKTGNQVIASALALPETHFLLEFVRPDFLGLRVISRALILWNSVQPTQIWIEQQIPMVVREAYDEMRSVAKAAFGSRNFREYRQKPDYDRRAIRQIYAHVVAGACFGMGLRYAGTGDERAKASLYERILELHGLREANDPVSLASRPEFPILETCLGCTAISLAMVLAGTGDLDALRLFKLLRWRCDKSSNFGSHMVYGMAIGLLFLGGGKCTIGREPEDIAALVTAFFPRYPTTTSDNQYHLQALRHLYTLAVKRKDIRAIDVDTGKSVDVSVDIEYEGQVPSSRLTVPALLRNSDHIVRQLRVVSTLYYPLTISISDKFCSFYVKRRVNDRIYTSDSIRMSSSRLNHSEYCMLQTLVANTTSQRNEANYACSTSTQVRCFSKGELDEKNEDSMIVLSWLKHSLAHQQHCGDSRKILLWNLSAIRSYYRARKRITGSSSKPLMNIELIMSAICELSEHAAIRSV